MHPGLWTAPDLGRSAYRDGTLVVAPADVATPRHLVDGIRARAPPAALFAGPRRGPADVAAAAQLLRTRSISQGGTSTQSQHMQMRSHSSCRSMRCSQRQRSRRRTVPGRRLPMPLPRAPSPRNLRGSRTRPTQLNDISTAPVWPEGEKEEGRQHHLDVSIISSWCIPCSERICGRSSARWCTTVNQGAAVVSDELGFDVSAHPEAASQVAN